MKIRTALFITILIHFLATNSHAQKIAILGAMPEEVQLLESQLSHPRTKYILGFEFKTGKLNGKKVVISETGIGKANAAVAAALIIKEFKPKYILFTGIAGAVNPDLNQGDIVIGKKLSYHDYGRLTNEGLIANPTRNPHTKQPNSQYFTSDSLLILAATQVNKNLDLQKITPDSPLPKIIAGTIVTGDTFVASSTAVANLSKTYQADATEMEGAAVAQICSQQNIPFLIIRSISDKANEKAPADFQTFKIIASDNSAKLVKAILLKL